MKAPCSRPAVHQLLDDRRADHDDEHEHHDQPPCAASDRSRALLLDVLAANVSGHHCSSGQYSSGSEHELR